MLEVFMGLRFRKSINLGGGVRLNFNKRSTGISFGTKGARYSINSNGRKTASVVIPGTGLYWTSSKGGSSSTSKGSGLSFWTILGYIMLSPFIMIYWLFKLYYYMFKYAYIGIKKLIDYIKNKKTSSLEENKD